jgi:hypothetical protein
MAAALFSLSLANSLTAIRRFASSFEGCNGTLQTQRFILGNDTVDESEIVLCLV